MEPSRILIAGGGEDFQGALARWLREEGFLCDCVPHVALAASLPSSGGHHLCICGMRPGEPGVIPAALPAGLPLIVISEEPCLESALASLRLKAAAYLTGRPERATVLPAVQEALERARTYLAISRLKERLGSWKEELADLEKHLVLGLGDRALPPLAVFLDLELFHLVELLRDWRKLAEGVPLEKGCGSPCHILDCPRPTILLSFLKETVEVLEKTRPAFKSKDLGNLRRRLIRVLKSEGRAWSNPIKVE
jgi:hypothetical protein